MILGRDEWVEALASAFFVCDQRRWSDDEKRRLRYLFEEAKLPIAEIASLLSRSTASVNTNLTQFGIPRQRSLPKLRMPTRITPAFARIHAHVCGDGHLFATRERDHYGYLRAYREGYYRTRYGFGYTNLRDTLLRLFMEDVREVFNLTPRDERKWHRVTVRSKAVWQLLTDLGAGKSRTWSISPLILRADDEVVASWIKAFFDDEAHVVPNGGIRVRSVNRPGLEQVAIMLRRFVPCHLTPTQGLYPDETCYLVVNKSDRPEFLRMIGSSKLQVDAQPTPQV